MIIKTLLIFIILFISESYYLFAQISQPVLPNTSLVITCMPDTAGYKVITVGPTGRNYTDLQLAINDATLGTVIILDAGATFIGGYTLPNKSTGTGWIIITTSRMDLLPLKETRINPTSVTGNTLYPIQAKAMAKILTNNTSGIPCFKTNAGAHHYRLMGLEITVDQAVLNSYGLINLGDASSAQNLMSLVPDHFVIDRCYIHGHSSASIMKFGVRLDCANAAIIDCYISDFHSIGYDAQAIAGINGPGPFKIINNYLEASGENILFGGAAPAITGLVPSDIEIRQNYFFKPFTWRVGDPTYAGKHWTVKNLFELKTGLRVLLDGNVMENSWADLPIGQSGYAILLTIRTESGGSPQADVSDITISNNIIRHSGAGISVSGSDGGLGNKSKRIKIYNNLFEDINGPLYGDQNTAGPNDGTFLQIGEPQDVTVDHNTIFQTGPITWAYKVMNGFLYTNNISNSFISTGGYQGIYGPGYTQGNNVMGYYFPDLTDATKRFNKNVLISGNSTKYSNYSSLSQNYFPPAVSNVGFVNYASGITDYHNYILSNSSIYQNASAENNAIGVNYSRLDSARNASRGCPSSSNGIGFNEKVQNNLHLFPNPAHWILFLENVSQDNYYIITDLNGKILMSGYFKTTGCAIDISTISNGMFFLKLISRDRIESKWFIKE